MTETSVTSAPQRRTHPAARLARLAFEWLPVLLLAPLVAANLAFFTVRAAHLLGYPFPVDYGEGPLLSQAQQLRAGTPIWELYADPGTPPYAVVNYPPVYLLTVLLVSFVTPGSPEVAPLIAGRLVSLLATLGCVVALWLLTAPGARGADGRNAWGGRGSATVRLLVVLCFLGIPIVREWAALMRVDTLGVCLGLLGLVQVRRSWLGGRGGLAWGAALLALSLFVKPSLIAAPAAALLWLLFRDWRAALRLGVMLGAIGAAGVALLQLASGGWFLTHVVTANANPLDQQLGASFWDGQLDILWPLFGAGAVAAGLLLLRDRRPADERRGEDRAALGSLPIFYTLFGAVVALGIGKVGAYLNYFLELYAGLVWLAAAAVTDHRPRTEDQGHTNEGRPRSPVSGLRSTVSGISALLPLLVAAGLLRYYPLWSETYLKPYGLIEGQSPARVVFGGYGVWDDLRREGEVLAALGRINGALVAEVRVAEGPIFTDLPGIAAQAGQLARHQAFEHRQLADVGLWDQRPLLRDMASGRVPLVVLDYLGNWLTPEMIAMITHRYAQDGSRGPYDLYRPVDPGPLTPLALDFAGGLRATGVRLASPGGAAYSAGELLTVTLEWEQDDALAAEPSVCDARPSNCEVVLRLLDPGGATLAESTRPLLYGVLPKADWGGETVQHMQPLALPPLLPPGDYTLAATLRAGGVEVTTARPVAQVAVGETTGRLLGEGGYFVPAPLLEAWARAGGYDGPGDPITPAVPFHGFTAQCFQRACFQLAGGEVTPVPLAELVGLGLTEPRDLSGANLGEEYLRLPGGVPYRWP